MNTSPRDVSKETTVVVAVAIAFVLYRTWLATQSSFGVHHGWNEGHYALIARGFLSHPLVPQYGEGAPIYNVPPLFTYFVAGLFSLFGPSTLMARLPSVLATGGTVIGTYLLGRESLDDSRHAAAGAVLFAFLPFVQLYGGRAQTDLLMLFLMTASLVCLLRGYRQRTDATGVLLAGGALFGLAFSAKQPAILLPVIVLVWLVTNGYTDRNTARRTIVVVAGGVLGLLPFAAWSYMNYQLTPVAFVTAWQHELLARTSPFANLRLLVIIGVGIGFTIPVTCAAGRQTLRETWQSLTRWRSGVTPAPSILVVWVVIYGLFVLYRTPHSHQYYAVALAPPIALLAARGCAGISGWIHVDRETGFRVLMAILLVSTAAGTIVFFDMSGEYSVATGEGTHLTGDAGAYLTGNAEDNAAVLAPAEYITAIRWYASPAIPVGNIYKYNVASPSDERFAEVTESTEGPVYVIVPSPSWSATSPVDGAPVYRTNAYRPTFVGVLKPLLPSDSLLSYYVSDRRLLIYRIPDSRTGPQASLRVDRGLTA